MRKTVVTVTVPSCPTLPDRKEAGASESCTELPRGGLPRAPVWERREGGSSHPVRGPRPSRRRPAGPAGPPRNARQRSTIYCLNLASESANRRRRWRSPEEVTLSVQRARRPINWRAADAAVSGQRRSVYGSSYDALPGLLITPTMGWRTGPRRPAELPKPREPRRRPRGASALRFCFTALSRAAGQTVVAQPPKIIPTLEDNQMKRLLELLHRQWSI